MQLLLPDSGLLFWMVVSFGVVFFILARFGFPVITRAVDKRQSDIARSLEAAQLAQQKLAEVAQQAEKLIAEARAERNTILEEAQQIKNSIIAEARDQADILTQRKMEQIDQQIEDSQKRAMGEISTQVVDLAMRIAEKVIGENLSSDQQQRQLIEKYLQQETIRKS